MSLLPSPLADGARLDLEGLALRLKVNPRARRVSLRIDARTGEAVATAPSARRLADAVAFARSRRPWLRQRLSAGQRAPALEAGETIDLFGAPHCLRPDGRRPRVIAGAIVGCGQDTVDRQLVIRAVRHEALRRFQDLTAAHCMRLGIPTATVSVTDARTRWGSCTPASAAIRLSWRLALAPADVADYVVAHECAHLIEANHGPRFWELVRGLVGDPSTQRAFLRVNGAKLHGFGREGANAL
jgi:hypothetical protein